MPTFRVMVCPVNNAASRIPFIFSMKGNLVALTQAVNTRSQINVVRNHKSLPIRKSQDKFLVPAAFKIIRQDSENRSDPFNLHIALMLFKCRRDLLITILVDDNSFMAYAWRWLRCNRSRLRDQKICRDQNTHQQHPFHAGFSMCLINKRINCRANASCESEIPRTEV